MAKRTTKKGKQRRLEAIRVDEISLVDSPAVPDARFVIAKRDDEVDVRKRADAFLSAIAEIRNVADELDDDGLRILADLIWYTKWKYEADDEVRDELHKFEEDLEKAEIVLPERTEKSEVTEEETTKTAAADDSGVGQGGEDIAKQIFEKLQAEFGGQINELKEAIAQRSETTAQKSETTTETEPVNGETNGTSVLGEVAKRIAEDRAKKKRDATRLAFDAIKSLSDGVRSLEKEIGSVSSDLNNALGKQLED